MTLVQALYFYKMAVSNHLDLDDLGGLPFEIPGATFHEWLETQHLTDDYKEWLEYAGFEDNTTY